MVGILAENPWSGWGRARFIQTAAAAPWCSAPNLAAPSAGRQSQIQTLPAPWGLEFVERVGWGSRSLGWVGGGGA